MGGTFHFLFKFQKNILLANRGDPDQTPNPAASYLGLHCLPVSHKRDSRLIRVSVHSQLFNEATTYRSI